MKCEVIIGVRGSDLTLVVWTIEDGIMYDQIVKGTIMVISEAFMMGE